MIYTSDIKSRALSMYRGGVSACRIARALRLNLGTVSRWIAEAGINRTRKEAANVRWYHPRSLDAMERDQVRGKIIEYYTAGMLWRDIIATVPCSGYTVQKILREAGIAMVRREAHPHA